MTIILFLIDTSASMCQKVHVNGVQKTYLDVAKGAVETFLKFRQRSQDCMGDRYMLLTFEEPPSNVKAGWKENHATFMNELKNLQSNGLTCMGEALKNGFDLLNLNRMQSGIDTYGQGRCPFYLETSVIIVITDGGKYSFRNGVHNEIVLPLHAQIPGTKLTKEPFRWDQRLFSLVLRMAGHRVDERIDVKVPHDDSPIEKMCEVTGGRSYKVRSHYVLNHCIESLVQKVQAGVVVQFDQLLPATPKDKHPLEHEHPPELAFPTTKKMIYVQKNVSNKNYPIGYWPLPEPYWPDPKAVQLPPRDAHPRIRVLTPCVDEPVPVRNFPVDKYELEPSPLTMQILARREPNRCWPVVVVHSGPGLPVPAPHELPFGYLKANNTCSQVYLVVLPLNYPVLLPLLHDLLHRYVGNPPNDWVYKFGNYVRSIPQYYCPFLRRALASISVPYQLLSYIIPENLDSYLSQPVANHLKALKNAAKQDLESLCMRIFKQLKHPKPPHKPVETAKLLPILAGLQSGQGGSVTSSGNVPPPPIGGPRKEMVSHPMLRDTFAKVHSECQFQDNYQIVVPIATIRGQLTGSAPVTHATAGHHHLASGGQSAVRASRNPFDIRRRDLVDEIARMRENFFKMVGPSGGLTIGANATTVNGAAGHCLPISEMGNYQEYLKNKETPLREIEPTNVRQHMFGNPYKKDKHMVMVDEADMVGEVAPMMKTGGAGGIAGGPGGPIMMNKMKLEGGLPNKMSRKRKAGPISREYKFRRLSTDSYGSSRGGSECASDSGGSSMVSEDFDDEEQRLVMDFEEVVPTSGDVAEVNDSGIAPGEVKVEVDCGQVGARNGLTSALSSPVKEEREEVLLSSIVPTSDRLLGHLSSTSAVPVSSVLTPSEGVLSPMYQQQPAVPQMPSIPSNASTPLVGLGILAAQGGGGNATTLTSQVTPTNHHHPTLHLNLQPSSTSSPVGGQGPLTGTSNISIIGSNLMGTVQGLTGLSALASAVTLATGGTNPVITTTAAGTGDQATRKHLPNGTSGSGSTPSGATLPPSLERVPSVSASSSSSNYNDADEISKILQQSCSQHNGAGSNSAGGPETSVERKKHRDRNNDAAGEEEKSTSSSSSTSGRKRRQMSKQASSELLDVPDEDKDKDTEATSSSGTRRQSPRGGTTNTGKTVQDRLSGKDEEKDHVKGWSSSRRRGNQGSGRNHVKSKANVSSGEEEEEERSEDLENGSEKSGGDSWLINGESVEVIRESNYEARTVVFHDIRRPGRDYGLLLKNLELIRGDFETQFAFIQMCIAEAMRFHRKKMATTIQEWWDQKIDRITKGSSGSSSNNGSCSDPRPPETTVVKVVKVEATSGKGSSSSSRQKSNVKLRSGTGSSVPSKC